MNAGVAVRGIYVTGTDTGIGKTVASAALLHALRARGLHAVGMKPVASGCASTADGWRNDDALALLAASDPAPRYEDVNPYALPAATAPELAAREIGIEIALQPIIDAYRRLAAQADVVVVEGVGGWAAPLSPRLDQRDLVRALDLSVVMVVGLRLGCINHARLTARRDRRRWRATGRLDRQRRRSCVGAGRCLFRIAGAADRRALPGTAAVLAGAGAVDIVRSAGLRVAVPVLTMSMPRQRWIVIAHRSRHSAQFFFSPRAGRRCPKSLPQT